MTIYRRLCLLVLVPNIVLIIALTAQHNLFKISLADMATAVAANIAAATLMRQESFVNFLFTLAGKCPRSVPLRLRRMFAKIYHFGGVHSGAGIAGTVWFTIFNAALLWRWQTNAIPGLPGNQFPFIIAITIVIDILLIAIVIFAHPALRRKFHNTFEAVHRFAGWLAVILFWIHLITLTQLLEQSRQPKRPLGAALLQSPAIYLLILITALLIIPWLRLRKVPVRVEPLSTHATRWHFQHTNPSLCSATRLSDHPSKSGTPSPASLPLRPRLLHHHLQRRRLDPPHDPPPALHPLDARHPHLRCPPPRPNLPPHHRRRHRLRHRSRPLPPRSPQHPLSRPLVRPRPHQHLRGGDRRGHLYRRPPRADLRYQELAPRRAARSAEVGVSLVPG